MHRVQDAAERDDSVNKCQKLYSGLPGYHRPPVTVITVLYMKYKNKLIENKKHEK